MAKVRTTRRGQRLVASTLYVPEDTDQKYAAKAELPKRSKSKIMVETLVANAPNQ